MRFQAEKFERNAEGLIKKAASASLEALVFNTRIDTSRMVSNWIVTRDGPNREFIEAHVPGRYGSTAAASVATTLANGRAEIEQFKMLRDVDLFITNVTPYLRYNDTGQGDEAAAVARAVLAGAKLF